VTDTTTVRADLHPGRHRGGPFRAGRWRGRWQASAGDRESMTRSADVVIIGAGLAGAATAYSLTRLSNLRVVILEQEDRPGLHASGQNAAMVRQTVTHAALLPLVVEGARFARRPEPGFPPVGYRACGSLILGEGDHAARLRAAVATLKTHSVRAAWVTPDVVSAMVPFATGARCDGAAHCRDDGVVDVAALLEGYLRQAVSRGARLLTGRRVTAVLRRQGRVYAVDTGSERVRTPSVVNAAGAWSREVAALARAADVPLRSTRRHLLVTPPVEGASAWPIVWDDSHGLYFRPESGGLLVSPCDEANHEPGVPAVDCGILAALAEKAAAFMPRLGDLAVRRIWAGLRTLAPDGAFVIGEDPRLRGFHWCAGLGGHGVTASAAVGRLTAEAVLGLSESPAFSPLRFTHRLPAA